MMLDEKEFNLFCEEVARVAKQEGVSLDVISTILAKAIKNRENEIFSQKTQVTKTGGTMQPVYGPPPRREEFVVVETMQPVYGPPPRQR